MRFLKLLLSIVVAAAAILFAVRNWRDVTIDLWGNLQADIKVPILLGLVFLFGFVPVWLLYRTRLWRLQNRVTIARRPSPPTVDDKRDGDG